MKISTTERPTAAMFYEVVVCALGKLTDFQPYVGVPLEDVRDEALRLAGIDLENPPWPLKDSSSKKRDGLYRVIHRAWYCQTRRHQYDACCAKPLTIGLDEIEDKILRLLKLTEWDVYDLQRGHPKATARARAKKKRAEESLTEKQQIRYEKLKAKRRELTAKYKRQWALTARGAQRARFQLKKLKGKSDGRG